MNWKKSIKFDAINQKLKLLLTSIECTRYLRKLLLLVINGNWPKIICSMHKILPFSFFSFRRLKSINMAVSNLTQQMKRCTIVMALVTNHSKTKIASLLKLPKWSGGMTSGSMWLLGSYPQWCIPSLCHLWWF